MDGALVGGAVVATMVAGGCLLQYHLTRSGGLDRNALVGLRTRATLRSDAAWRAGHLAAQPALRLGAGVAGGAVVAALAVRLVLGAPTPVAVGVAWGGAGVGLLVLVVAGLRADRAARREPR